LDNSRVKAGGPFADTTDMNPMSVDALIDLLKKVLLTPEVIGVTVVIALYVNIVSSVVSYRKKKPVPKTKKRKADPKPVPAEKQTADDEDEEMES